MRAAELSRLLRQISAANSTELRALWAQHGSGPCPAPALLCRYSLAWQLQARVYGGLSGSTRRRLQELSRAFERDPEFKPPGVAPLQPGTEYLRHWKGAVRRVRVTAEGYQYEARTYQSLSEIARHITGTQWSGPKFFGLKSKKATA
jgi:Protein of unknown function (DUF2924)